MLIYISIKLFWTLTASLDHARPTASHIIIERGAAHGAYNFALLLAIDIGDSVGADITRQCGWTCNEYGDEIWWVGCGGVGS